MKWYSIKIISVNGEIIEYETEARSADNVRRFVNYLIDYACCDKVKEIFINEQ